MRNTLSVRLRNILESRQLVSTRLDVLSAELAAVELGVGVVHHLDRHNKPLGQVG